jgi:GT2 family glycosyltransferase
VLADAEATGGFWQPLAGAGRDAGAAGQERHGPLRIPGEGGVPWVAGTLAPVSDGRDFLAAERDGSVCAVIPTTNRRELLRETLQGLRDQDRPVDHVIVVDNASTDGTAEMLAAEFPDAELVRLLENTGSAGGFHTGLLRAHTAGHDWMWILDNDSVPRPDALRQLFAAGDRLEGLPAPVLLLSRVVWTDGRLHPMNLPGPRIEPADGFLRAAQNAIVPLRTCAFAGMLVHRSGIDRVGLPLAEYFTWCDDTEYSARLLRDQAGYYVYDSVVVHKTQLPYTAASSSGPRFYYAARNGIWLVRGRSLVPKERVLFALYVGNTIVQYLRANRLRPRALGVVARGLRDGVLSRPPAP